MGLQECRGQEGSDFYLQIDEAATAVLFVGQTLLCQAALRAAQGVKQLYFTAKLGCALWLMTIGFLPTTLHSDTPIPAI